MLKLTCRVSRPYGYDDDSIRWHDVQILCHTLHIRTAFRHCVYAHGFSNAAIARTAYRRFDI